MKVLELKEFNRIEIAERPDPEPGPGQVLLDLVATGICGSDIHGYTGHNGRRVPGQVMGHETVGLISALGAGLNDPALTEGAVATFNPLISCGKCSLCSAGQQQHCPERTVIGVNPELVSAFAQKIVVPAGNVVVLNADNPIAYGALIEPLAVAFHAARRARIKAGDKVLITGGGPIGQSCVLAALHEGAARVLVSEPDAGRRELCVRIGAAVVDPAAGSLPELVSGEFGGPSDVTIDAAGITSTITGALESTRFGGVVLLVGMGAPRIELPAYKVSTEERELIGSFAYTARDFDDAAAWVNQGSTVLATLISREVSMDEADAAFRGLAAADGTPGKVIVRLDRSSEASAPAAVAASRA
ncbi:zinc-binding alcohol dehydrogenase [Pseudarthrobacter phenanthrenivorans]|uniref:Zinc-binding alcohol dehydrogenase n=1 Tax=Pseudarthrobacter phenanthrenivorans TaxID=361575 RepID=A0A3B0F443_PSEPS|nr:alcohol dehydrogenase catalytic domain-containing protein [Pseudarthrobacter phenanthrenivorans]RKO19964.1 zinc-binding alcohol dehydrogenase [Pseudarthrobacter phenanthrenivorans]